MITYTNKKHLNGLCSYCYAEETVEHVILYCAEYENERQVLIIKLHEKKIHDMSLKNLLARKQGTKEEALQYIKTTRLCLRI